METKYQQYSLCKSGKCSDEVLPHHVRWPNPTYYHICWIILRTSSKPSLKQHYARKNHDVNAILIDWQDWTMLCGPHCSELLSTLLHPIQFQQCCLMLITTVNDVRSTYTECNLPHDGFFDPQTSKFDVYLHCHILSYFACPPVKNFVLETFNSWKFAPRCGQFARKKRMSNTIKNACHKRYWGGTLKIVITYIT